MGAAGLAARDAHAQAAAPAAPPAPAAAPAQAAPSAPAAPFPSPAATAGQAPAAPTGPTPPVSTMDDSTPLRVPTDLLEVHAGGLTADEAGHLADKTSWNARAAYENLRSASARVDEAWGGFLPRLSGIGKYTRLSNFTSPNLFNTGGAALVGTLDKPGTINPPDTVAVAVPPINFFVLDNWLLQGTITVPISDYFLSIDQKYTAATRSEDAARWDLMGARATALSNGKITYYTWLRNRGAVIVAVESLNDQKTHLRDARNQFAVGNASKADVLRAETAVASAELTVEQASNLSDLTEKQLRVAMHVAEEQPLQVGEELEAPLPPFGGDLKELTSEAIVSRPEIKSADANAESARESAKASRAQEYPVLSAFADGIVGNPNPRVIPPTNTTFATWDVGAQITWSPNDIITGAGSIKDYEARAANIEANAGITRDGIVVEVQQMWQNVREADFAIESSTRQLASAEEAYRVQRELFNNGRGTSTTLTDAESDLTGARLTLLNARAEARIARIRLDHALGRDVKAANEHRADNR